MRYKMADFIVVLLTVVTCFMVDVGSCNTFCEGMSTTLLRHNILGLLILVLILVERSVVRFICRRTRQRKDSAGAVRRESLGDIGRISGCGGRCARGDMGTLWDSRQCFCNLLQKTASQTLL